uniref:Uncharacterized protein n=1 Tax=Rhizophora mucronata TaxID=61149 RepID=A0A2P2PGV8_RHIMU
MKSKRREKKKQRNEEREIQRWGISKLTDMQIYVRLRMTAEREKQNRETKMKETQRQLTTTSV